MARQKGDESEARGAILAAAEALFAERGYAGTSVRDIAAAAGVNGAMIHYYFESKEGLYQALLGGNITHIGEIIETASRAAESSADRLASFIEQYASFLTSRPSVARIIQRELLTGGKQLPESVGAEFRRNHALLRAIIEEGVRRGELRAVDLDLAPVSLIGMIAVFHLFKPVVATTVGEELYGDRLVERLTAHTVDLFLNGVGAWGASP